MTSNFQQIREHGILKADPMLDRKDWSFDHRGEIIARYKNKVAGNKTSKYKEIRKPLPTPLETRLALQSRLLIAAQERGNVPLNHAPKKPAPVHFVLIVENKTFFPEVEKDGETVRMPLRVVKGTIIGTNKFREEFSIVKRSCNLKVAKIRARVARVCGDAAAKELDQCIINLYK
jgi:hypothetical protein